MDLSIRHNAVSPDINLAENRSKLCLLLGKTRFTAAFSCRRFFFGKFILKKTICGRRKPHNTLEFFRKIKLTAISQTIGDLFDSHLRNLQKIDRALHFPGSSVLHRSHSGMFFEKPIKMTFRKCGFAYNFVKVNFLIISFCYNL